MLETMATIAVSVLIGWTAHWLYVSRERENLKDALEELEEFLRKTTTEETDATQG